MWRGFELVDFNLEGQTAATIIGPFGITPVVVGLRGHKIANRRQIPVAIAIVRRREHREAFLSILPFEALILHFV